MNAIDLSEFTYQLPSAAIAEHPLAARDQSRLLVYQSGQITHSVFHEVGQYLPDNSILFFNNTKVIPARILFTKATGATIELFLLAPRTPLLIPDALQATRNVQWECAIGNRKRWTPGSILKKKTEQGILEATLTDAEDSVVEFSWTPEHLSFAEILAGTGLTPLPPYIRRQPDEKDALRYQTVYSTAEGAVAAPTAGLHFTPGLLEEILQKGIAQEFLTLHVSAGTFAPIKVSNAADHPMHTEHITITRQNIESILMPGKKIIAVGTTSMRTLESVFWYGANLIANPQATFDIKTSEPYLRRQIPSLSESLDAVLRVMTEKGVSTLSGTTSIFIVPGYQFKVCSGLITNFHQPGSTLILLVAAFAGPDWRRIYEEALTTGYRFLSYGDSSLLLA